MHGNSSDHVRGCWCGTSALEPFSPAYRRCASCQTLVSTRDVGDVTRVGDGEHGLYGRDYWFTPGSLVGNFYDRARRDLTDRCLTWLAHTLKYAAPPGRVLELGCAHGGFTAMLRDAGFDAAGLELSPAIAEDARRLFDVTVLVGRVEDQHLPAGSQRAIIAMDVIEHLPDPLATVRHAVSLLEPDGCLVLQTPEYPADVRFEALIAGRHPFADMLMPEQHLYLFSRAGLVQLLKAAGCPHVAFEPAPFAHYDMFVVASPHPLRARTDVDAEAALARPTGRFLQAMLDLGRERLALMADNARLVADIDQLTRQIIACERDRADRLAVIEAQGQSIAALTRERRDAGDERNGGR